MKRIVGLRPRNNANNRQSPPPPPGLDDIAASTNRKVSAIDSQIAQCEAELRKVSQQMKNLPGGLSKQSLQTKAKSILMRKKRLEQQAESLRDKSFNMESLSTSITNAEDMKTVVGVMKSGTKNLKKDLKKLNLDKIDDFQEELAELTELTEEIQGVMTRTYGVPLDIDDEELNAQLEILGDEIVQDNDPSYIDAVLRPPSQPSSGSLSVRGDTRAVSRELDEFGLPILNLNSTNAGINVIPGGTHAPSSNNLNF